MMRKRFFTSYLTPLGGGDHMKHDADISRNNVSYAGLAQRVPADDAAADSVASDEAASPPSVDWAAVVAEAGLDVDEIAFLTANKVQNVPQRDIPAALGWAPAKAARIRKRVDRRLAGIRQEPQHRPIPKADDEPPRGNSLHPAYLEHLPSGYRVWSLNPSNKRMCPQLPISVGPISRGATPMSIHARLAAAREALAPLLTKRDKVKERLDTLKEQRESKKATARPPRQTKT
jgi:hypothetical protein